MTEQEIVENLYKELVRIDQEYTKSCTKHSNTKAPTITSISGMENADEETKRSLVQFVVKHKLFQRFFDEFNKEHPIKVGRYVARHEVYDLKKTLVAFVNMRFRGKSVASITSTAQMMNLDPMVMRNASGVFGLNHNDKKKNLEAIKKIPDDIKSIIPVANTVEFYTERYCDRAKCLIKTVYPVDNTVSFVEEKVEPVSRKQEFIDDVVTLINKWF